MCNHAPHKGKKIWTLNLCDVEKIEVENFSGKVGIVKTRALHPKGTSDSPLRRLALAVSVMREEYGILWMDCIGIFQSILDSGV